MAPNSNIEVIDEVIDGSGNHRLLLRFIEIVRPRPRDERGFDFHSMIWESKVDSKWKRKLIIRKSDFQGDAKQVRWISEIHRLDPHSGCATIKVAEEGPPDSAGTVRVKYSWRDWDLVGNKQIRVIQECQSPQERFPLPTNSK
jgi:hypothetical protein